jgi:hypothetical protein
MKEPIKLYADFQNADRMGRIRLITAGTLHDLKTMDVKLEQGQTLWLDDDEGHCIVGIAEFSKEENIWVAKINGEDLKSV